MNGCSWKGSCAPSLCPLEACRLQEWGGGALHPCKQILGSLAASDFFQSTCQCTGRRHSPAGLLTLENCLTGLGTTQQVGDCAHFVSNRMQLLQAGDMPISLIRGRFGKNWLHELNECMGCQCWNDVPPVGMLYVQNRGGTSKPPTFSLAEAYIWNVLTKLQNKKVTWWDQSSDW